MIGRLVHSVAEKSVSRHVVFYFCCVRSCSSMYQCSHSLLLFAFYFRRRLFCAVFFRHIQHTHTKFFIIIINILHSFERFAQCSHRFILQSDLCLRAVCTPITILTQCLVVQLLAQCFATVSGQSNLHFSLLLNILCACMRSNWRLISLFTLLQIPSRVTQCALVVCLFFHSHSSYDSYRHIWKLYKCLLRCALLDVIFDAR